MSPLRHEAALELHRYEVQQAEHKHKVLQQEAIEQHREHTQLLQALEEKVENLTTANESLQEALYAKGR